ncbi:ATP-binding protein [Nicoliella lavandulae]|uniref:ATP-binding protein n=1 Tax=Nicoliella lavandulae TaxID=3082954 RepID=A0ABU8SL02_9LACO
MALKYQDLLTAVNVVVNGGNVPNIVGTAGIGKSALVADLARQNGAKLFTTVVSLAEKGDLAIPVPPLTSDSFIDTKHYGRIADVQFGYSHTLIEIIQFAEAHPDRPVYWFLDEFNRGSQAVQSELMNLVLQRQINSLRLPTQVHIIIAENPDATMTGFENSTYSVMSGDDAIKDRTVRLVMRADVSDWLTWAQRTHQIHPLIINYLKLHPEMLNQINGNDDIMPTPRAWQRLSDNYQQLLKLDSTTRAAIQLDIFAGDVGVAVATALNTYLQQQDQTQIAKRLFDPENANTVADFVKLDEVDKVEIIKAHLQQTDSWTPTLISRLNQFMPHINPDGQYACAHQMINNAARLDELYQLAMNGDANSQSLYQQLQQIGIDNL